MADALKNKIADVFDEPACGTNVSKSEQQRKKGCARPLTPGAAAGGCAFDGAKIALQPIVDVAHLVHAPLACEGNGWDNQGAASSGFQRYRTGFTTDMTEIDIVMSYGEKNLFRAIREVIEAEDPPAVFVYSTCVPALIGVDIDAVCKAATARFGTPCIPVNAPGYVGSKNLGNKLAGEAMLDHVIGTVEPAELTPYDINIVGDYNLSGELWQLKPLLDRLGIRILGSLAADARYRQVAMMHRAKVTMMLCSKALINVARKLEERYGLPYFEGSFYGISDTSDSLRQMWRLMVSQGTDPALLDRCESLIAGEEAAIRADLEPFRRRVEGRKVLLYSGGHQSWSVVAALQELGMAVLRLPPRHAERKIRDPDRRVRIAVAHRLPRDQLLPMTRDEDSYVRSIVARRAEPGMLAVMLGDADPEIRRIVARRIGPDWLDRFRADPDPLVRREVALRRPELFVADDDMRVRHTVAEQGGTEDVAALLDVPEDIIRETAAARLAQLKEGA
ncbi:nitrogenase molybdenum-cofactor synthesis protein NifE [Salipiger thiooxidans]|uniref:Nitrogenase molybdenum-cofactor synthesis protein NifE n=1 Tax=Salipiger thiooxidans TaxID=282683 RepID=A0A1G7HPS1_9RHOB|nr:nitrogenase component 1 [Salipiger thiooxidans]SDF02477.1 nitrogenase molybdenum-cofactor synthesis protein NifE [Salipiger thiooxidans]